MKGAAATPDNTAAAPAPAPAATTGITTAEAAGSATKHEQDAEHAAESNVAVPALQQQQQPAAARQAPAQPGTAMGLLFSALADSDGDESE
jgi:hypothetical protein